MRKRLIAVVLLGAIGAVAGGYFYLDRQWSVAPRPSSTEPFEISRGLSARAVLSLLRERNIIADENAAMAYVLLSGNRGRLKAGEYLFDKPMTVPEVIGKLAAGDIYLHRFTVPEGLTAAEIAVKWQEQGFGASEEFAQAVRDSVDLVLDLEEGNPREPSVEGYLFPETYFFPIRTTPQQAIRAMVSRFRVVLRELQKEHPGEQWPLNVRETVILASLIEEEAAHESERPIIASVFLNRLKRRILLQCDPTVIYALVQANKYLGRLTTADLRFDSPYNTYRYAGLPPGAISNPGRRSLRAATQPATSAYLFFVRTIEGRHTFSETLAAHNRAVAQYRAQQRRK